MINRLWHYFKWVWLAYLTAKLAKGLVKILLKSCTIRVKGLEEFSANARTNPSILMLWHNRLVPIPEILNAYTKGLIFTAFISKSRDGNALAYLTESYSIGRVLRVPHNNRHLALAQLVELLKKKEGVAIITPDGPRGPKGIVKPGIILAAKESGASIYPLSWKAQDVWTLKTWDHMQIPKPFTTIEVTFGSPELIDNHCSTDYKKEAEILKDKLNLLDTF